ncbi:hypothetical protein ACWCQM_15065 [Streptomyces sp. NPDC002125]
MMVKVALAVCVSLVLSMLIALGAGILLGTDKRTGVIYGARALVGTMTICLAVIGVFLMAPRSDP